MPQCLAFSGILSYGHPSPLSVEHLTEQGWCDGEKLRGLRVCETYKQLVKLFLAGERWVQRGKSLMRYSHKLQNAALTQQDKHDISCTALFLLPHPQT